jgi:hypothetical protein
MAFQTYLDKPNSRIVIKELIPVVAPARATGVRVAAGFVMGNSGVAVNIPYDTLDYSTIVSPLSTLPSITVRDTGLHRVTSSWSAIFTAVPSAGAAFRINFMIGGVQNAFATASVPAAGLIGTIQFNEVFSLTAGQVLTCQAVQSGTPSANAVIQNGSPRFSVEFLGPLV